jgi:hypothetical protein
VSAGVAFGRVHAIVVVGSLACAFLAACAGPEPVEARGGEAKIEVVGPPRSAADLAWMAGEWRTIEGDTVQEERWSAPLGGILLGTARTVIAGKARFFEYLRIEERPDGLVYVASPLGRGTTDFRLTDGAARRARFENPAHDWPTAIEYELRADGRLAARVSGPGKTEEYAWDRAR